MFYHAMAFSRAFTPALDTDYEDILALHSTGNGDAEVILMGDASSVIVRMRKLKFPIFLAVKRIVSAGTTATGFVAFRR